MKLTKYIGLFFLSFIISLVILAGAYVVITKGMISDSGFNKVVSDNPELMPPKVDEKVINVLLMGVDEARSDIMILASINKENKNITLVSIPRDTRVLIPGYNYEKINSAAGKKEGAALAMETVSQLLKVPVHAYIKVDFKGAENLIDVIGGVTVDVPIDMDYEDPVQNLYIHIKKGRQLLNGENAVKFVRFRHGYADQDLGRIKAQQQFLKALAERVTSSAILPRILNITNAAAKCIKTNLTDKDILDFAMMAKSIDTDKIKMFTLPGNPGYINGVSYYVYDPVQLINTMNQVEQALDN